MPRKVKKGIDWLRYTKAGQVTITCLIAAFVVCGVVSAFSFSGSVEEWVQLTNPANENTVTLGGTGETNAKQVITGLYDLTLKDADSSEDQAWWTKQTFTGSLGTASSTFLSIQNTSNYPWFIDRAMVRFFGATSSTVAITMGTSSIAYSLTDTVAVGSEGNASQIFGALFATSTPDGSVFATSTSGSETCITDDTGTCNAYSNPFVVVMPNEYIIGVQDMLSTEYGATSTADRGYGTESFYRLELYTHATST